jgi:hypothetical protein
MATLGLASSELYLSIKRLKSLLHSTHIGIYEIEQTISNHYTYDM